MAVKLNKKGYDHAGKLIRQRHFVVDEKDAWSEHEPSTQKRNEFLGEHGYGEYEKWFLGIDDERKRAPKEGINSHTATSRTYTDARFFRRKGRAGQFKHVGIENAAAHLHGSLDAKKEAA